MTVLGALARTRDETRAIQATAWGDWGDGASSRTYAGVDVTESTSLQLLTVYGCVRFICDGISTLPLDVLRRRPDGSPEHLDRLPTLLQEPAAGLDFTAWATQFLTSLLLAGNFYGLKVRRGTTLEQVIPLDPTKVQVKRDGGRRYYEVAGLRYDAFQILHVPGIMWPGSDVGVSPVEAARQTVGSGMAAAEYGARFFDQDSTPGGVIEAPQEGTPDEARKMARAWARAHAGKAKNGMPGVLFGGATWKQVAVTNEQAQFLETRRFTSAEIAAGMFLIDPPEMGIGVEGQSLTYTNLEQRNIRKVQVTFLPWIVRLEHALTGLLPRPQYVKLNVNGLLRGDMKTRFDAYAVGIDKKFMVPNEARAFEDWPPLPGGDEVVTEPAPVVPEPEPEPRAVVRTVERDELGQVVRVVESR